MARCSRCGEFFTPPRDQRKFFDLGTPEFCSLTCLRRYIESLHQVDFLDPKFDCVERALSTDKSTPDVWSAALGMAFRSQFEVFVAESFALWDLRWLYEQVTFRQVKKGWYVPDFFVENKVWIEVKGVWGHRGKEKFLSAAKALGEDRVILIPWFYVRDFEREAKKFRREACVG